MREAPQDGSAYFAVDLRKSQRPRGHLRDGLSDFVDKFLAQANSLIVVPILRGEEFRLGLWPDN